MNLQQKLREQTYQLKNQITDLKNAFDINRTILSMLSKQNCCNDPQHTPLMQIISRLTQVNNQIMLKSMDLIQERNSLKQETYKLTQQLNKMQQKLATEIMRTKIVTDASQYKMMMQEQLNNLNRQLMAANEERILRQHHVEYWKLRYQNLQLWLTQQGFEAPIFEYPNFCNGKRKYQSNQNFKQAIINEQLRRQNKKMKIYIEEIEAKLSLFIKSYTLQQSYSRKQQLPFFRTKMNEIQMLKLSFNNLRAKKGQSKLFSEQMQCVRVQEEETDNQPRHRSWPKHKEFKLTVRDEESDSVQIRIDNFQQMVSEENAYDERRMLQSSTDPFHVFQ